MVTFAEPSATPTLLSAHRFVSATGWAPTASPSAPDPPATDLQLITWNMHAGGARPKERFARALQHVRITVFRNTTPPPPCCILLQEVHQDVLPALLRSRWLRAHFLVAPVSASGWTTPYGLVTLVSASVPVSTVFVVDLPKTAVARQALFVDLHISAPAPPRQNHPESRTRPRPRTLRIANTHLEPAPAGARVRPTQLEQIARLLNVPNVAAHICAGSMCSADAAAPAAAGFADAYTGRDGMTWGHHPRTHAPPARLDKVLYFPTAALDVGCPRRIGFRTMLAGGGYVSDHVGLLTTLKPLTPAEGA